MEKLSAAKPTVLIVDDCSSIRKMFAEVLSLEGYPIMTGADGEEGLQVMRLSRELLVVVTGLMMPVLDGWEMLRRAGREGLMERHAVLVVSGNSFDWRADTELRHLRTHYHVECQSKPNTADQLIGGVERAAERLRAMHA